MGVVRDVTIDQLTQAVQGISTSGMSDTTGQAINNTLGTLMTNTTGQAINTTLQSLVGAISQTTYGDCSPVSGITLNYGKWSKVNNIVTLTASITNTGVLGANTKLLEGIPSVGENNINGIIAISSTFANTKINNAYLMRIYSTGLYTNAGNELPVGTWIINGSYKCV